MIDLEYHSPIQQIDYTSSTGHRYQVDIKRDDQIHPLISGNKWRKLKYLLRDAAAQGKQELITFGGAWSNHLLATACAASLFGFRSTGIVRGEPVQNPVLKKCSEMGMKLIFVSRSDYRDKPALFEKYGHKEAYCISEGGFSPLGAKGCEELIDELPYPYDHIICACGTGTTLAGMAARVQAIRAQTILHGIPVLKNGSFIYDHVKQIYGDLPNIRLHTDYHFGGYAKTTPLLNDFVKRFHAQTGLVIEPTYTGKALYGLFDLMAKGVINPASKILFIHTGGLMGVLGYDFTQKH